MLFPNSTAQQIIHMKKKLDMVIQNKMANNSVEIDSENIIISLLLVNINRLIELEWGLFVTNENKA